VISNATLSVVGIPLEGTLSRFHDHVLVCFKEKDDKFLLRYFFAQTFVLCEEVFNSCHIKYGQIHIVSKVAQLV